MRFLRKKIGRERVNEKDILFQICFFFMKPDKSTKISLKRVRFVMINDLRYFSLKAQNPAPARN